MSWKLKLFSALRVLYARVLALFYARIVVNTSGAVRFNIMGIIFMMIAIALGSLIGSSVASMFGFAGGIVGSIIVGFVVYAIWALVSGRSIKLWAGIIFAVLVWLANIIAGYIQGATGFGGGIIGLAITAFILSMLVGYFGVSSGVTSSRKKCRRKRKR